MDKYRVKFADSNGRRAALELCCFCQKVTDLNHPETCVHFAEDYVDKSCSAFVQVDNVEKRLQESLAVKAVTPNTKIPGIHYEYRVFCIKKTLGYDGRGRPVHG